MRLAYQAISVLTVLSIVVAAHGNAAAGVLYGEPTGGWDYAFEGNAADFGSTGFTALDGTWSHDQGDEWDGSAPGSGAPGGVGTRTEGNTDYLIIQDPGDPTAGYGGVDPSNRKIYFGHDIEGDVSLGNDRAVLDNGITLSFRARLSTTAPLDGVYDEDTAPTVDPWPADGKGYEVYGGARGQFGVIQQLNNGAETQIAFSMIKGDEGAEFGLTSGGLVMNNLADIGSPLDVNTNDPGTKNWVEVPDEDLLDWREFWITIQASDGSMLTDTHEVTVYMDGQLAGEGQSFLVTDGQKQNEILYQGAFVAMAMNSGSRWGALDIDFFSYAVGLHDPVEGALALTGDMDCDGDVDFDDIDDFVLGLNNPAGYEAIFGVPPSLKGDTDGDGDQDFDDINGFVGILQPGGLHSVPEPATGSIAFVAGLAALGLLMRRRNGRRGVRLL